MVEPKITIPGLQHFCWKALLATCDSQALRLEYPAPRLVLPNLPQAAHPGPAHSSPAPTLVLGQGMPVEGEGTLQILPVCDFQVSRTSLAQLC